MLSVHLWKQFWKKFISLFLKKKKKKNSFYLPFEFHFNPTIHHSKIFIRAIHWKISKSNNIFYTISTEWHIRSLYITKILIIYIYIYDDFADRSRERPEGSVFNRYYTEVQRRALLFFWMILLPLIHTLYC